MAMRNPTTLRHRLAANLSFLLLCLMLPSSLKTQTADPALVAEIAKIKAIDHHAHPLRVVRDGEPADNEYDALALEEMEPFPNPVRIRPGNPEYIGAWHALYGYAHNDMAETHVREMLEIKKRVMREQGDSYPMWVLDRLGIEIMFANRVAMGRGLVAPRFRWVSIVDPLLFPLSNEAARRENPDYRSFYAAEEKLLRRYLADSKVSSLPQTLEEYLSKVVTPTLERQKRDGAIAVKFEVAYLRSTDFAHVPLAAAKRVYARFIRVGEPPLAEYKQLQDFLFRYLAQECGRLGLPVHIHITDGAGSYYDIRNANPSMLDPVFNDPALRGTNFVIIHGGWPYTKVTAAYFGKPNVYADFSALTFLLYPRALSEILRDWLEFYPERVLFGTDAFPATPEMNWEETGWLSVTTGRQALAIALSEMMNDGEITRERALELARMVLRENAIKLYNLQTQ
ncbi:amidohydrolase [candidate division KSB1 bacterium]|nr:MAG: amidohydrolase [candidate division KSB1 bacterium]MBC6949118.1 amidohydrolase [candidate division KSB1 bacterium]MCE7944409.1 amidohydrolase [Chlorobi bacterium CHB1]